MPKKYHVPIKSTPPRFHPVGKYATIEFRENCAGSCKNCVKKECVYGIFKENYLHMSAMDEPEYLYECQSCFRCVQECTKGIFSRVINPEYRSLGDEYWKADIVHRTWYQAHTGKIPVSGAGYRGPFVGKGFDSMWTDMSEIVRPTRDGIHGREYINTSIELSRRPSRLEFRENMAMASEPPPIFEIPLPIVFKQPDFGILSETVLQAFVRAACELGTLMIIRPEYYSEHLIPYVGGLIPSLTKADYLDFIHQVPGIQMLELAYTPRIEEEFVKIRALNPDMIISVGIPLDREAVSKASQLARTDVDTLHFYADDHGNELNTENPRFLKEMIRDVHLKLVKNLTRNRLNLIFSGGIAMAEHMAKAIICGADGVAVDISLLIALECRLCQRCKEGKRCPAKLAEIGPEWGSQRIINLMGAWRNQLLEVMGAMGIREARRLRGEVGRSMNFEDLEAENFGPIFGTRKVSGLGI
ncbi:glutamate synthase-related protein [Thermodesulfobacteriota bacterium]